ncbi:IS3 family transposase [Natroniella acetigena]|uniref:IS3 family transposase n=1 Tax=Natroniella acetigena TaxID=52004 RepID=UPI00200AA73C|nr:IS3 family transposase [Natroniella acetigena]MCK8826569.1 IS3 family transposase [Natroniella acetigena]
MDDDRRTYSEQFKRETVELSFNSEKTCKEIAEDLGLSYHNLIRWRKEYRDNKDQAFPGQGKQKLSPEQEEIKQLKEELRIAKQERDIFKKSSRHIPKETKMKYGFIREHRNEFPITRMCQVLGVSRSGYYSWLNRKPSKRKQENYKLKLRIAQIYSESRGSYGSPRIYKQLKKEGFKCNKKRIERLMRVLGLKAIQKRKFRVTTDSNHNLPIKENLLERKFDVTEKNKVWVSDITYISTKEGWLYLAVMIDLYSRKIVGWSMQKRMTKNLVIYALNMAIKRRNPEKGLIVHSDQGSQYASHAFQKLLWQNKFKSSMSRKGNCWDNAVAESFFGTLKTELVYHNKYQTRSQAKQDIFKYIEIFYNRNRLHSTLDYKSPEEYENERKMSKLCV